MAYRRGSYYYRSRREDGRIVTDYLGHGAVGQLAAEFDRLEQAERRKERRMCHQQMEFDSQLDKNVQLTTDAIRALTDAVLLCNGCHTHKGQWRKLRA